MEGGEGLPTTIEPISPQTESASGKIEPMPEPKKVEGKLEQNMTPKEEASGRLGTAQNVIQEYLDKGLFGKEGEENHSQAQIALLYEGTGGASTKEASLQLQAMMNSVRQILGKDSRAEELNSYFRKNLKVDIKEEDKTIRYSISEWEGKLETIQKDLSLPEEERIKRIQQLKQEATCGFLLQEEEAKVQEQPKPQEDRLIGDAIKSITEDIASLKASGQDVRDKEALLANLELANNAKGELGIFFKADAIQRLKASGVEGVSGEEIGKALEELNLRLGNANEKFAVHLEKSGVSRKQQRQLMEIVKNGDIEKLILNEHFNKIKDLDQLIFAKKMTEQELLKMLNGEEKAKYLLGKYGKKGLMGILLMLLLGIVQAADLAKGELGAR